MLSTPAKFEVMQLLEQHFFTDYHQRGASRLPRIAMYSMYECLMGITRFHNKTLLPLKNHKHRTYLGDIELVNPDGSFFEVVEVKHQKPITAAMVRIAYEKIKTQPLTSYYLLTTSYPETNEAEKIGALSQIILEESGCELTVNGVLPSIKYYLRIVKNPQEFIELYSKNLIADYEKGTDIKQVHIEKWLSLLTGN